MRFNRRIVLTTVAVVGLLFVLCAFLKYKKMKPTIFIVEEHHEALAYWFYAVDQGLMEKQGNLLIHIDGHSDESTPEFLGGMPLFRYPNDDHEMAYFLQKNDVFIQGAVMFGLISRVIWIWPSWDENMMKEKEPYESKLVELGWFWNTIDENVIEPHFCQCETVHRTQSENEKKCSFINGSIDDVEKQETKLETDLCQIKTSYISEHVNEKRFADKLRRDSNWISTEEAEKIVLDIDEDYFGCENVAKSITEGVGPSWSVVESIDAALRGFLCPKFIGHEEIGNDFLRRLLKVVLKECNETKTVDQNCTESQPLKMDVDYVIVSEFRRHPSLFCGYNDLAVRKSWSKLAEIFYVMPPEHVLKISNVGFCFSVSPKTLLAEDDHIEFVVCHGLNPPNSTIVFLHSPEKPEIADRMDTLSEIVESVLTSVRTVTICRSVRDGYSPRGMSQSIENGILQIFDELENDKTPEVFYDDDLLGGKLGWSSRIENLNQLTF